LIGINSYFQTNSWWYSSALNCCYPTPSFHSTQDPLFEWRWKVETFWIIDREVSVVSYCSLQ
jgi:hypothetical protein